MKRRDFIKTTGLFTVTSGWLPFISGANNDIKPNLLFIFTDQQRYDTLAAYGNGRIKTPHLNKLAQESVVFKNAYVSQPVCTPSRSTLLTGQFPHTNGCTANNVPLNENTRCLPEMISDNDYETAYFGKWHLGDEIFAQHGFKEWAAIEDAYIKYYTDKREKSERSAYYNWLIAKGYKPDSQEGTFSRKFITHLPLQHSKPKFIEEQAKDFLIKNKNKPFMLYLGFFEPHSPYHGPYDDLYGKDDVDLPFNFNDPLEQDEPLRNKLLRQDFIQNGTKGYNLSDNSGWKEMISNYWGLVSQVDVSVGAVLDKLEELGLKDNTIVVFTSDHGDMMGSHKMVLKTVMYEEAARVPFIIRYPQKLKEPQLINNPVSHIDVVPTLLELLSNNSTHIKELQGHSLLPFLEGGYLKEEYVFYEWNPNYLKPVKKRLPLSIPVVSEAERKKLAGQSIRAVVSPDSWKLCLSDRDKNQLYDLNSDPYEMTNLYYLDGYQNKIRQLRERIVDWQGRTNDTVKV